MKITITKSFASGLELIITTHITMTTPECIHASRIIGSKVMVLEFKQDRPITHQETVNICNLDDDTFNSFASQSNVFCAPVPDEEDALVL